MSIERYTCESGKGVREDWDTEDIDDAREFAQEHHMRLIALIYQFSDSEMIEDYTMYDKCKFCETEVDTRGDDVHKHEDGWVCEECWDERLRVTE